MTRKTFFLSTLVAALAVATMGLTALSTPAAAYYGSAAGYSYGAGYRDRDDYRGYYHRRPITRYRAVRMMRRRGFRNIYGVYYYRGFWVVKARGRVTRYGYRPWYFIRFIGARNGRMYRNLPRYGRYRYRDR